MKKIKKLLLAFAPLTAIAISTPIVLTACSDTTTNTTTPGGDNGSTNPDGGNNGGNGGGNGSGTEGSRPTKPSITKDDTNSDTYKLSTESEAQKILDKYKVAKGQAAAEKVLTDELANFPKQGSKTLANDVLNMWSNNNWFTITKNAKDPKVKETFVSSLTINKAEVAIESGKNKATFDVVYKSGFVDSNGKVYEATQLLKADKVEVDSTTKIDINKEIPNDGYKIDGEVQKLPSTSLLAGETTNPQENFESFLKKNKVSLDAKVVFSAYINNHKITHAEEEVKPSVVEGTWSDSVKTITNKATVNAQKTQIDVLLNMFTNSEDWYTLKKTSTEQNVRDAIYKTTSGVNNLTDTFKNLVNVKDSFKTMTVSPSLDGTKKILSFAITLTKNDNTTKSLKINIRFKA